MSKIPAPKGFEDILPADSWKWHAIEAIARELGDLYHFQEIRTPILEHSDLFHRGVGETTDIVHKETFTFKDRGGDSMTLRPEGTAGVVRAMIEHNLLAQEGSRAKVYYLAPNFRYERPQKGRLRQHHQFGAEAFGISDPAQDVECILLQMDFYRRCGIKDLSLQINSLGDAESKQRYRDALVAFLKPKVSQLSEDSQRRLETNPLRILDSKDLHDQEASKGAPSPYNSLSEKSRAHFDKVQQLLTRTTNNKQQTTNFVVNPNLVRGFDYYTETLWEVTASGLGSQNALGGGGRYDNLVENLGGRPTPGVGFGSGLERLLIALEAQGAQLPRPAQPLFYLTYNGEAARDAQWKLLYELRAANLPADMDLSNRSMKAQFKLADRESATHSLILGDTELANETITLKDLKTGEQSTIPRAHLLERLKSLLPR
ncbi:MAG TPA: histidine--tRNA ligase [Tepidisphaeraceae bacterium]|jgi:histidyl-tRNA synthetase|nr:histidine--tRNA ligase [Tepidisphaeraceae bacterium]